MSSMSESLMAAQNAHDAEQMAALFAEDYLSRQPVHPGREFRGRGQVLANWSSIFAAVTDFAAELSALSVDGDTEWAEWSWGGHHTGGAHFAMRGVTILTVRDGHIAQGRLYMEPVEPNGQDIDASVEEMGRPSADSACSLVAMVSGMAPWLGSG